MKEVNPRNPPVMASDQAIAFGPFRLDPDSGSVWHGAEAVPLTPKAFAVLSWLAAHPGKLITKDELLDAAWPGVFVGDGALKVCIREIRRALDDDPKTPRYIETAHRRGYRFVAPVSSVPSGTVGSAGGATPATTSTERPSSETSARGGSPSTSASPDYRALTADTHASTARDVIETRDLFHPPRVQYAQSGDVNIAYQVIGDGPFDLVFVMGWVSHLEYFWREPSFARFLRRLASFSRLILFDKRGTGLSDRVTELPTLEQRMDDVRAVMEAVGSERAALLGVSEGGPMCSLFAATYPQRTVGLVMIGTYAKRIWDPEYPWAPTAEARERFCDEIREQWGGPVGLEVRAPSVVNDPAFREWWATYLRMGASPGAAQALTRMNAEIDVRHVLPTVRVPTLIVHRTADRCLLVEEGRYVASRIPGARFVELPGEDHLPFVGDQDAILDEIEEFLTGFRHSYEPDRVLATVLVGALPTDHAPQPSDGRDHTLDRYFAHVQKEVDWFRGRPLEVGAHSFLTTFDGPARAIRCGAAISAAAERFGVPVRIGLHTGECDVMNDRVSGVAVEICQEISAAADAGEVLVSRTVKDLVAGSGLLFTDRFTRPLRGAQGDWQLFAVKRGRPTQRMA